MSNSKIKHVCVIDDDDAVRDSLQALLRSAGLEVRTYGDAASFLEDFNPAVTSCALIDVRMPEIDGIELLEIMEKSENTPPIVIITGHGEVEMAVTAMKIGAFDFIEKPFEPDALIERVNAAIRWGDARHEEKLKITEAKNRLKTLTPRETDVLGALVAGMANKAIARKLKLSPRTIEVHRARVMEKTKSESLTHLVRLAMLAGIEPDGDRQE